MIDKMVSSIWKPEVHELLIKWVPYIERNEDSVVCFVRDIKLAKKWLSIWKRT